jgi:SOS response regulatory protein OraA/RecX
MDRTATRKDVMPSRLCTTLILTFLALRALSLESAPHISPASGSDAILAVRSDTQAELRLQYRVERDSAPPETITVGLAKDYHYKNSAAGFWINDYRLHRIFRVQPGSQLIDDSLYADAWVRGAELENRAMISAMLKKAGVDASKGMAAQDPYWAETELGVTTSKFSRPDLKRSESKERISWAFAKEEVVAVRYRQDPVPDGIRAGLRRWWPSLVAIHPQIADELAQSGRMPEELWVKQMVHAGKAFETAHWSLIHTEWNEKAHYPLSPGLAAVPTESRGAFPEIFSTLVAAVAEQRRPPAEDEYRTRVESAIAHTAGLEAYVWLLEMQLASGVKPECAAPSTSDFCALAARVGPLAKMDSRLAVAFAAHSTDAADRPQFNSLPNAYVLRLLWATRPPGKEVKYEDSEHDLLVALQTSPIANFCKDTGDFYAGSWRPFAAWQVWDLGRLMANHRSGDLLDGVDVVEADVVRREPALF